MFTISERDQRPQAQQAETKGLEEFNLEHQTGGPIQARCTRVPAACWWRCAIPTHGAPLKRAAKDQPAPARHRRDDGAADFDTGAGEYELAEDQIFSELRTGAVQPRGEMAEKEGKPVELLVVPAVNPFDAMVQTAAKLQASRLVTGVSARMDSEELARRIGLAWESAA